mmetsp:Transcript_17240/g.33825  ORF Transcript_17240/g.33825 Transcript_17240/m.33825 type:complete len:1046 (-) Transcript_17240:126-3263(-)
MESDTVFVRGLQPGVNDDELNEAFSDVGPVKSAFIVVEKDGPNKGQSRGFGFVQFSLPEDAAAAVQKLQGVTIGDGPVRLTLAEKRGFKFKGGATTSTSSSSSFTGNSDENNTASSLLASSPAEPTQQTKNVLKTQPRPRRVPDNFFRKLAREAVVKTAASHDSSKAKSGKAKADSDNDEARVTRTEELLRDSSVILFNLPAGTNAPQVRRKAGKAGKVNMIEYPLKSLDLGTDGTDMALVVFTKKTSAANALRKLDQKVWQSESATANSADAADTKSTVACRRIKQIALDLRARSTRCRLIVRNLNFSADESKLRAAFAPFGPVLQVFLGKGSDEAHGNNNKKSMGYAFVQFACRSDAQQAVQKMNGEKISGRVVAVDWALDKRDYERLRAEAEQESGSSSQAETKEDKDSDEGEGDSSDADDNAEEENSDDEAGESSDEGESSSANGSEDEESESESEDDKDEDEDPMSEDDEEEEMDEDEDEEDNSARRNQRDEDEKSNTLFIRNVLFETTEEELFDTFKQFGGVRYVRVVKGHDGRSRGTAFVNFYNHASFERALQKAAEVPVVQKVLKRKRKEAQEANTSQEGGSGIMCSGRPLFVTPAVRPEEAQKLVETRDKIKNEKIDRRHLYLSREGQVHEGDGIDIPQQDLQKRQRAEREKRTKLRSPMFFVSPTRLSVRNLYRGGLGEDAAYPEPTEKSLAKIFRAAAQKGLEAGLVDSIDGDETLFPRNWPDRKFMKQVSVKNVRIMREASPLVHTSDIEMSMSTSVQQGGVNGTTAPEDQTSGKGKGKVTRNKQKVLGRSTGFAFVEFAEHVHALAALRMLNNNPAYAYIAAGGPRSMGIKERDRSRLIVEFSVENTAKLRVREKRMEKQRRTQDMQRNAQLAADFASGATSNASGNSSKTAERSQERRKQGGKNFDGKGKQMNGHQGGRSNFERSDGSRKGPNKRQRRDEPSDRDDNNRQNKQRRKSHDNGSKDTKFNKKQGQSPGAQRSKQQHSKQGAKPKGGDSNLAQVNASAFRQLVDQYKAAIAPTADKKKRWFEAA